MKTCCDFFVGKVDGASPSVATGADTNAILQKIAEQGDKVRELKALKAEKSAVDVAVKVRNNQRFIKYEIGLFLVDFLNLLSEDGVGQLWKVFIQFKRTAGHPPLITFGTDI